MRYHTLFACLLLFISSAAFSQSSTPTVDSTKGDLVFERVEVEAEFPGGDEAWTQYIRQHIEKNIDVLVKDDKSGTCRVKFIVDKNGNVKNVEALTMQDSKLAKIAIRAILKGPKWIPASQNGRKVNAYREQPITFTLQ